MVFTGEASWRWRMLLPSTDRSYDTFWRQAIRWLALPAGDPIQMSAAPGAVPGDVLPVRVIARDAAFEPLSNVTVDVRVTAPDGRTETLRAGPDPSRGGAGHHVANVRLTQAGVLRLTAEVRQGSTVAGTASTSVLVGGADLEMADPRVNEAFLGRVAAASGGRLLSQDRLVDLPGMLRAGVSGAAMTVQRDLWHTGWSFGVILVLLAGEWILRRRWGLR